MVKPSKATITDVAKRAGVSIGTVSRVVNGASNCKPDVRERVQKAVDALNYAPNHAARSLKRRFTEQIELVVPDIANPVYVAMAKAVQGSAKARGYRMSLISTDGSPLEESLALKSLERQQVDGLIIISLKVTPKFVAEVEAASSRVCVVGRMPPAARVDNVRVDSAYGAALAVKHLAQGGRKHIAFINGEPHTAPAEARYEGYLRGLTENHLGYDAKLTTHADFTMAGGYTAVDALLAQSARLDAVFCADDVIAVGALRRLRELGKRVPDDIAVVGMDDIDLGKVSSPTLTTVSLLAGERGRVAAELLFERLGNPDLEPRKVTVMPKLIIRESSVDYLVREPELTHAAT